MRCPSCGAEVEEGAVVCRACDYILDTSFLGEDITDDRGDDESDAKNLALEGATELDACLPSAVLADKWSRSDAAFELGDFQALSEDTIDAYRPESPFTSGSFPPTVEDAAVSAAGEAASQGGRLASISASGFDAPADTVVEPRPDLGSMSDLSDATAAVAGAATPDKQERAERAYELALKEHEQGRMGRARMYARLAASLVPDEPRYQALLEAPANK